MLEIPVGRRSGHAVVIDPGGAAGFDGPKPVVLTVDRQVRKLTVADVGSGVSTVGFLRVPKGFSARVPAARRDLAAALRSSVGTGDGPTRKDRPKGDRRAAQDDAEIAALRRQLRAHPCHSCPDREEHARWAERWARLARRARRARRPHRGRTGSIAAVFDRICDILLRLGYLATTTDDAGRAALEVTDDGRWLRRLYAENDLLLAECLRRGVFDELDAPGLAAAVSTLVYRSRRDDQGEPRIPGGPNSRLGVALDACVRAWSELDDLETAHKVETIQPLDAGLVEAVHRWAAGRSLDQSGVERLDGLHLVRGLEVVELRPRPYGRVERDAEPAVRAAGDARLALVVTAGPVHERGDRRGQAGGVELVEDAAAQALRQQQVVLGVDPAQPASVVGDLQRRPAGVVGRLSR